MSFGRFILLLSMIGLCLSASNSNRLLNMKHDLKPFLSDNVFKRGSRTAAEEYVGHVDKKFWFPKYNHLDFLAEGKENGFEKMETDFMLVFARMIEDIEKSVTVRRGKVADKSKESGCSVVKKLMTVSMDEVLSFSPTLSKWLDIFNRFCTTDDEDAEALIVQKIKSFGFRAKERPARFDMKHKFSILPRLKGTTYWFGVLEKLLREEKQAFDSDMKEGELPEDFDMVDEELPEDFVEEMNTQGSNIVDEDFSADFIEEVYTEGEFPSKEELFKFIQEHADEMPEGLVDEGMLEEIIDEIVGSNLGEEIIDTFPEDEDTLEEFPDLVDEQYPAEEFGAGAGAEDFEENFERDVDGFADFFPKSALEYIFQDDPKATAALGWCMWEDHVFRKNTGYRQGKATQYDCHCPAAKCTWTCEQGECYTCLTKQMFRQAIRRRNREKVHAWKDNCEIDLDEFGPAGRN